MIFQSECKKLSLLFIPVASDPFKNIDPELACGCKYVDIGFLKWNYFPIEPYLALSLSTFIKASP